MKRQKTWAEAWRPFRVWAWIVAIACMIAFWAHTAHSAVWNYPVSIQNAGQDTTQVYLFRKNVGATVYSVDSTVTKAAADIPVTVQLAVADTADWQVVLRHAWGGIYTTETWDLPYYSTGRGSSTATIDGAAAGLIGDSVAARLEAGSGPYGYTIVALDTSKAPDEVVPRALLTFRDLGLTTNIIQIRADDNGLVDFYSEADSLAVLATNLPYHFFPSTWDTVTGGLPITQSVSGYSVPDSAGSAANRTCYVKVYVIDNDGTAAENVLVSMAMEARGRVVDSAGHVIANSIRQDRTDSLGIAGFVCLWSSYLVPATNWRIQVLSPGFGSLSKSITVPRDTVYTVNMLTD